MTAISKGHSEHTQAAGSAAGLAGAMPRPINLTMLGAGSGFTPRLVNDVLMIPGAGRGEIRLVDTDDERLSTMERLIRRVVESHGREGGWTVRASRDRRELLAGTDYLINCIEVSGLETVALDNDIPARYGVDQCIGDTIGPGGLMKALRTGPVFLDVLRDAEDLCPDALVLNYTNPMSILCLAAGRASSMRVVGLCHSVQSSSRLLAKRAGVPYDELAWECAGINHLAWFTRLEHDGRDLYPVLKEQARQDLAGYPADPDDAMDLVRKDMMLQFGAFITESSGHLSEYLPYYRKRPDLLAQYARSGYHGESRFYASNWPEWRRNADAERLAMLAGERPSSWERSWEYASWIVEAREKDAPFRIHGNVMNSLDSAGPLIANLPADGCVEVACLVDRNGVSPTRPGRLPAQMAAVCASNMSCFDLAATAVVERSREAATHALMLDPLTAAVCSPAEIRRMADELFEAQAAFLPGYK